VVIHRHGAEWLVRCGPWYALNLNLDVALMAALRGDSQRGAHSDENGIPAWARDLADKIESSL
jgi:hypothetical protein